MLMLVVLSSNITMVLQGNSQDLSSTSYVPEMNAIRQEAKEDALEARRAALEAEWAAAAAWRKDPPETWAPPERTPSYVSSAADQTSAMPEMRKE